MYAVSLNSVKSHQLCSRVCPKSCCRVQKLSSTILPSDKNSRRKNWWKTGVKNVFGKYLLLTNTISSGVLMAVGDLIQQELEFVRFGWHSSSFDWKRNMNMVIVGTCQGPLIHFFYTVLDKYFPGVKLTTIIKKICLDQVIGSPIFIMIFFFCANFLEGKSYEESKAEIKEKFWFVYAVDCSVWIPAQFLNFYFFSGPYRVIYINLLAMCYNVFLSSMKHTKMSN